MDKNTIKKLIFVFTLVAVVFLGMNLLGPEYTEVERTVKVDKGLQESYDYIALLKNMEEWHFWKTYDENIIYMSSGPVSGEGATLNWSGNDQVGNGFLKIIKADAPRYLELQLKYTEPWDAEATNYFEIVPADEGSKITWGYKAKNSFISRMSMLFMNMDELLGADYEIGLEELKEQLEKK